MPPTDYDPGPVVARTVKAWAARTGALRRGMDLDDLIQASQLRTAEHPHPSPGIAATRAGWACRDAVREEIAWRAGLAAAAAREAERPGGRPAVDRDDRLDLAEAIDGLDPDVAATIRARYLDGLTIVEAATALGVGVTAVAERTRDGLAALRAALAPSYGEEWGRAVPLRDPARYRSHARRVGRPDYHRADRAKPAPKLGSYARSAVGAKLETIRRCRAS